MYNTLEQKNQESSNPRLPNIRCGDERQSTGISYPLGPPTNDLRKITRLLGEEVVLVPYRRGTKKPMRTAWQKTTLEQTRDAAYRSDLETNNVGVLLGEISNNLVVVDGDKPEYCRAFKRANPEICEYTLVTQGKRGLNYWFRIVGDYPKKAVFIKNAQGDDVGEFRGGNCASIIAGRHPEDCDYRMNEVAPLEIRFEDIVWPEGYSSPRDEQCEPSRDSGGQSGQGLRKGTPSTIGTIIGGTGSGVYWDDGLKADLRSRLPEYLKALGVGLKPAGERLVGLCPNHDDHNPSFSVFGDNHEVCGCFPCNYKGDVFQTSQWVGRSNSFPEALRDVATVLGVTLPSSAGQRHAGPSQVSIPEVLGPEDEDLPDTPFPVHCIPGFAGEMAREIARVTTSQNLPLAAASVIGALSASLGAGLEVSCGGERRTKGNLYLLAIAESGTGKGEAFSLAMKPFEDAETAFTKGFEMSEVVKLGAKLSIGVERAKNLEKRAAREEDPHKFDRLVDEFQKATVENAKLEKQIALVPQLKVEDTTKEALAEVMAGQPGGAIASLSSEARGIFSIVKGKYGKEGGEEDFYCKSYSGEPITVNRIGRGKLILPQTCLTVLWMVQPDSARSAFADETLTGSGFLPRFLTFDPKAEPLERDAHPAPIPEGVKSGWADLVTSLLSNYRMNGQTSRPVVVGEGVGSLMLAYENENIRNRRRHGDLRDIAEFVARWTENAWRMALVLHGAKHGADAHNHDLDVTTSQNAIEIVRWFVNSQLGFLAAGRHTRARSKLSAVLTLLTENNGEISLRELRRSHSFDREEIERLQAKFPALMKIVKRQNGNGRPSEVLMKQPEDMKE